MHPPSDQPGSDITGAALHTFGRRARRRLPERRADELLTRARVHLPDAWEALSALYGDTEETACLLEHLLGLVLRAALDRPKDLRSLDRRREIEPDWFQAPGMVGYVCYVERFAGTLRGVEEHLDHLDELGVTYLHLMPLLKSREGEDDGGYAVSDYRAVEPRLGTIDDLERLARRLRRRGISLCTDVVINHTAHEHDWASRARAGDVTYRDYYRVFPDRTLPDEYERSLREVFPTFARGSFTFDPDLDAWVWTTFNRFQWDLNYENPAVFAEMLDVMLFLANRGVEVLRLDAVPFTWKRLGTTSENQPEAHLLLQAWRALVRIAAPAVVFKAEAIVGPDELLGYLGVHDRFRPECDLAYHNQLMVMLWSSVATRDVRLATTALGRLRPAPSSTAWCTYLRCHDDIGWAVDDADAAAVGWDGASHRRFLADFYAGRFPGSFARGSDFQRNDETGDVRTSGSAASLCGIERALETGDPAELARAVRRLVLLYSVVFGFGGVPLVYMGDELAQRNHHGYEDDPLLAADNRWMHRPPMDWEAAGRRHQPGTLEGEVFGALCRMAAARARLPALHAGAPPQVWTSGNPQVLGVLRHHPRSSPLLVLANVSEDDQPVPLGLLEHARVDTRRPVLASDDLEVTDGTLVLPGLGFAWYAG